MSQLNKIYLTILLVLLWCASTYHYIGQWNLIGVAIISLVIEFLIPDKR